MRNQNKAYLDGEKLFRYYYVDMAGGGTFHKLALWAHKNGMQSKNPRYDKRLGWTNVPSDMGVHKAAWRWASWKENKDKAYEWYQCYMQATGDYCTPEEWREFAKQKIKNAWQFPTKREYHQFLKENGWI